MSSRRLASPLGVWFPDHTGSSHTGSSKIGDTATVNRTPSPASPSALFFDPQNSMNQPGWLESQFTQLHQQNRNLEKKLVSVERKLDILLKGASAQEPAQEPAQLQSREAVLNNKVGPDRIHNSTAPVLQKVHPMCSHQVSDHGLLFQNNDISINDDDEQLLADALIDKSDGNAADQFDFGCDSSSSDIAIDDVNHVSINKSIASSVKTRRKKPPSKSTSEESDIQPKHKHDTKISKQTSGGNTSLIQRIRSRRSIVKSKVKKGDFCLYSITDGDRINPLHTLIRRDILEGHVIDEDIVKGGHKVKGTVCFRCIWCKDQDEKSAYAAVYPRSIESIYRGIGRFQKKHIR